jgi:hypothetical protein
MITSEYILELSNVFHSGQVEAGTCIQKMIGTVRTGVILKDVSLEVHGGELSAVLGSKGMYLPVQVLKCQRIKLIHTGFISDVCD